MDEMMSLDELLYNCNPKVELSINDIEIMEIIKDMIESKLDYIKKRDEINKDFIIAMKRYKSYKGE